MEQNSAEAKHLLAFIERIERLSDDAKQVKEDIADVYAEAAGTGFDKKIIRKIVAIRRQDASKRREEEETLGFYMKALGMLGDTPLGRAAVQRDFGVIGKPVELTDIEREMGVSAAFVNDKGIRSSIRAA